MFSVYAATKIVICQSARTSIRHTAFGRHGAAGADAIVQAQILGRMTLRVGSRRSAALDPATRADMQKLVRTLWEETGTTILFVTHNIAEALYLGTRVVLLGKENPEASARVVFELVVPDSARTASGYPRREEIERMTKLIEDAAMGGRLEVEMAEFAG